MKYFYEKLGTKDLTVVHHTDMDGYVSAVMINTSHWRSMDNSVKPMLLARKLTYTPMNYNYEWDIEALKDKDVIIVDISFGAANIDILMKICEVAHEVRWVDHHVSSKEAISDPDIARKLDGFENLQYAVNTNICATLLMSIIDNIENNHEISFNGLEDCYRVKNSSEIKGLTITDDFTRKYSSTTTYTICCGKVSRLVDLWDRFAWKEEDELSDESRWLNSAFYALPHSLTEGKENSFFSYLKDNNVDKALMDIGKILTDNKEQETRRALKSGSMYKLYNGYNAWVLNASGINPTATREDRYARYDCDVFIIWRYSQNTHNYVYSVYTRDGIDAVEIAQHFEPTGGGHRNAAGFTSFKMFFS